jgi:hypothetical protein
MQSYRRRIRPHVLTPVPYSHIRYYGIKPADDLRVTSYCDNESFSRPRRPFIPEVDSSSWYLKSDHDVIMKLSSVREGLPFELSRDTSRVTKTRSANTTTSPDPSNSMCKPTTEQQRHSMNFVQTIPSQSSIHLPAELPYSTGISLVTKYARSEPNSPSTSSERTFRDATTGQTRYMIPSVGLLTESQCRTH